LQAGCPSCRPTNSVKALKGPFIDSLSSKPANTAKIGPVDVEIIGLTKSLKMNKYLKKTKTEAKEHKPIFWLLLLNSWAV